MVAPIKGSPTVQQLIENFRDWGLGGAVEVDTDTETHWGSGEREGIKSGAEGLERTFSGLYAIQRRQGEETYRGYEVISYTTHDLYIVQEYTLDFKQHEGEEPPPHYYRACLRFLSPETIRRWASDDFPAHVYPNYDDWLDGMREACRVWQKGQTEDE